MKLCDTYKFYLLFSILLSIGCASAPVTSGKEVFKLPNPGGEKEKILNEKGDFIENNTAEPAFFSAESADPNEFFRVIISSDSYQMRQIRGTDLIARKPDPGGDLLITDELKKYDLINFKDDGIMIIKLNPDTGKLENINFHTRVPRINDIAKIIQNDATRWILEHKKGPIPVVTKYLIYYNIILTNKSNREDIKNKLKKEVKKY
ncbi:MAG: hypothetical protein K8R21_12945 [Leptospira sp.]|nr:hypothetical protein [Leptospira sp.]